ncbi:MAG: hypothetical protein HYT50_00925, partial [Candidatus Wildermuthbacteria bacterium]|nr:hypothetical protein [Candidatus Wildermuthbacteria bacterium]
GKDDSLVEQGEDVKSIGKEHTFDQDTRDPETLTSVFQQLAQDVYEELLLQNLWCRSLTVVVDFPGLKRIPRRKRTRFPCVRSGYSKERHISFFCSFLCKIKKRFVWWECGLPILLPHKLDSLADRYGRHVFLFEVVNDFLKQRWGD